MSISDQNNRRRQKRYTSPPGIHVVDHFSNKKLGKLVNIHQEGLLIMGICLNIHSAHQITLLLSDDSTPQTNFHLGIECLWHQEIDDDSEMYWCGCSIIDKSLQADTYIESLISAQP